MNGIYDIILRVCDVAMFGGENIAHKVETINIEIAGSPFFIVGFLQAEKVNVAWTCM